MDVNHDPLKYVVLLFLSAFFASTVYAQDTTDNLDAYIDSLLNQKTHQNKRIYSRYFDESWNVRYVGEDQESLVSDPDYSCQVKAYGWKLLATENRKTEDDWWFESGALWQKWAWRVVIYNARDELIEFESFNPKLFSDQRFELDSDFFTGSSNSTFLDPEDTEVFQNTLWYNTSETKGEGKPDYLDWTIRCREGDWYK